MLFCSAMLGSSIPFFHKIQTCTFRLSDLVFSALVLYIAVRSVERGSPMYGLQMLSIVLLYLSFRAVGQCYIKELFAVISAFTVLLTLWGICQSVHILPGSNHGFSAIGNFDNPAGYASALAIGFPTIVYLWKNKNKGWRAAGYISALLVVLAIVLSKSRAGIVSVSLVLLSSFIFGVKNKSRWWKAILACTFFLVIVVFLYFLKRDSADGRLLIWMVSLRLISKFLFFGGGTGVFGAMYMPEQANYFRFHPDSRYAMLADNIGHPLNEYLSIVVQWGLIGLVLVFLLIYLIFKAWLKNRSKETDTLFLILLSLASFSCFSYPLSYPFGWVMLTLCLALLGKLSNHIITHGKYFCLTSLISLPVFLLFFSFWQYHAFHEWYKLSRHRPAVPMCDLQKQYEKISFPLSRQPQFLYNYSAEFYFHNFNQEALEKARQSQQLHDDYEMEHLIADIQKAMNQNDEARDSYLMMSMMCPNRFIPIYKLFELDAEEGNTEEALSLANIIMKKTVKVPSPQIDFIQKKCFNYIINH